MKRSFQEDVNDPFWRIDSAVRHLSRYCKTDAGRVLYESVADCLEKCFTRIEEVTRNKVTWTFLAQFPSWKRMTDCGIDRFSIFLLSKCKNYPFLNRVFQEYRTDRT